MRITGSMAKEDKRVIQTSNIFQIVSRGVGCGGGGYYYYLINFLNAK